MARKKSRKLPSQKKSARSKPPSRRKSAPKPGRRSRGPASAAPVIYPDVPASNVGNVVQAAIDFNGATDIGARQSSPGFFTVSVHA